MLKDMIQLIEGYYWPIHCLETFEWSKETLGMTEMLVPLCKKTNTLVQAGGNCGLTIKPFCSIFKNIYTFEPDPVNFLCLNLNINDANVYKYQSCIGDKHEMVKMDTIYPSISGAFFVNGSGTVPTLKIDDLNLLECDMIMLDIEGYELKALNGAIETIKKYNPVICIEHCEAWLARYGTSLADIENLLINQLGYTFVNSYVTKYSTDIIYVKMNA